MRDSYRECGGRADRGAFDAQRVRVLRRVLEEVPETLVIEDD